MTVTMKQLEKSLRWEGATKIEGILRPGDDAIEAAFRTATLIEEIRGVTWDLWGQELSHEQAIQRIIVSGFPIKGGIALKMFAIVEGESGEYQRAWHANVERLPDGIIKRYDAQGLIDPEGEYMKVKSIDLGFMQFNVEVSPDALIRMTKADMDTYVDNWFTVRAELADPWESAALAYDLWLRRGFQPWYAYRPGTEPFALKMRYGALAFSNWLVHSYVGRSLRVVYAS